MRTPIRVPPGRPASQPRGSTTADPRIRGPFPILSTPFTDAGEVDFEALKPYLKPNPPRFDAAKE